MYIVYFTTMTHNGTCMNADCYICNCTQRCTRYSTYDIRALVTAEQLRILEQSKRIKILKKIEVKKNG